MLEALKTLEPFRNMDTRALHAAASHARMLRLPPQRTVLRAGQEPRRELFLHKGTVTIRLGGANRRLDAAAAAGKALGTHGADEIVTLTSVEAISVDRAAFAKPGGSSPPTPEAALPASWIPAFLQGPVMRWFPPSTWAWVVKVGEVRSVQSGETLFRMGEVPQELFVVVQGAATCGTERFGPGDAIGAAATLTRAPMPADTLATAPGVFVRFSREALVELLDDYEPPDTDQPTCRLDLDTIAVADEAGVLTRLDPAKVIAVRGADRERRAAVASRLMQAGFAVK